MKKLLLVLMFAAASTFLAPPASAQSGSGSATRDLVIADGSGSAAVTPTVISQGSGSGVVVTTTDTVSGSGATTKTTIALPPDPIAHPLDFAMALKDAWSKSWGLAIGFLVYALVEVLAWAGKKQDNAKLAWLGKGRISIVIGAAAATMPTFLAAITGAGAWGAFITAIVTSVAAFWHPAGTDPAKA
jgi:hypothetical protein